LVEARVRREAGMSEVQKQVKVNVPENLVDVIQEFIAARVHNSGMSLALFVGLPKIGRQQQYAAYCFDTATWMLMDVEPTRTKGGSDE